MKVSYIITPSVSTQYLIRCLNSLYRQTNLNFEIILAENRFDEEETEEIETYLEEHSDIKRISPFLELDREKIREGLSLLSEDTDYMAFLSADTVVAPITTELVIKETENPEFIISNVVVKGKDITFDRIVGNSLFDVIRTLGLYRVFYGTQAISEFKTEFFENEMEFELYKFHFMITQKIKCMEQVCFYTNIKEATIENAVIEDYSKETVEVVREAIHSNQKEVIIKIFDYYLKKYVRALETIENGIETQEIVYETIKNIGVAIQEDVALSRLFQLYVGCTVEEIQYLDLLSYQIFKNKITQLFYKGKEPVEVLPTLKATRELQEKQEKQVNTLVVNQKQFVSNVQNLKELQEKELTKVNALVVSQKQFGSDMEELKANMHYLMKELKGTSNQNSLNFMNPIEEIPVLFSQGKLGFTVIIKSIKAWLTYKIKGKR